MHFAEFGLVMMLFLIGLELRPRLLWQLRVPILGIGVLQVAATSVAVTAASTDTSWMGTAKSVMRDRYDFPQIGNSATCES